MRGSALVVSCESFERFRLSAFNISASSPSAPQISSRTSTKSPHTSHYAIETALGLSQSRQPLFHSFNLSISTTA